MGPTERALSQLGAAVGAARDEELRELRVPEQAERLVSGALRRKRWRRAAAYGSLPVVALALLLLLVLSPRGLSFEVGGAGAGRTKAWISAQAEPLPVSFSDGSVLLLEPEARGRVMELGDSGARFVLEQGKLSASVVHREASSWTVVAGPFEVRVTGTRFDVQWTPAAESFELRLLEGSVQVTGPSLGSGRAVRAGESLVVALRERAVDPSPARPAASSLTPEPRPAAPSLEAPAAAPSSRRADTLPALRALSVAGDYAELMRIAEASGFTELCLRAGPADLMLLADAARLSGKTERAAQALGLLRDRFARHPSAATAAFLLGRIALERDGAAARAARWFETYLDEQPSGPLAGDALIRLSECRATLGDADGARSAARRYLTAHPQGPHAERARRLGD